MSIRKAEKRDVPHLVGLWTEFMDSHSRRDPAYTRSGGARGRWATYIGEKLEDPAFHVLVADAGDELSGYVVATILELPPIFNFSRYGFIQEIAVAPPHQRRGIARQLVRAAEAWLLEQGVGQVRVNIDWDNEASQALFRNEGFGPHSETLVKKY